jgi:hypothetical protein
VQTGNKKAEFPREAARLFLFLDIGFRVQGSGFRVQGSGFRVQGKILIVRS